MEHIYGVGEMLVEFSEELCYAAERIEIESDLKG